MYGTTSLMLYGGLLVFSVSDGHRIVQLCSALSAVIGFFGILAL